MSHPFLNFSHMYWRMYVLLCSQGWCWWAPPPHPLPPSSQPSIRPSSLATRLMPPSPVRWRALASIIAAWTRQPPPPKSPVRMDRRGSKPQLLQPRDRAARSKPKRSHRTPRQQTARRPTSQPSPCSAFSPLSRAGVIYDSHISSQEFTLTLFFHFVFFAGTRLLFFRLKGHVSFSLNDFFCIS